MGGELVCMAQDNCKQHDFAPCSFSANLRRLRVLIHYSNPACNVKEQITFHFEVTLRKILTEPTPLALTRGKHSSLPLA